MPNTLTSAPSNSTTEEQIYQLAFLGDTDAVNTFLESDPKTYVPYATRGYAASKRFEELFAIINHQHYKKFLKANEIFFEFKLANLHLISEIYYSNLPSEIQNSFDPNPLRACGLAATKAYEMLELFMQASNYIYLQDAIRGLAFNNDLPSLDYYQRVRGANPYAIASSLAYSGHIQSAIDYQKKESLNPVFIAQILEDQYPPDTVPYYQELLFDVREKLIRQFVTKAKYHHAQAYYQGQTDFFKNTFFPRLLSIYQESDRRFKNISTRIKDDISKQNFKKLEGYSQGLEAFYQTFIACELAKAKRYAHIGTYQKRGANCLAIARAFESINNPVFAAYYQEAAQENSQILPSANKASPTFSSFFFSATLKPSFKQLEINEGIELTNDAEATINPA